MDSLESFGNGGTLNARRNETAQLRRAESALARSSISLAEAALREGNGPAVKAALETVPASLRDPTWAYLQGEADTSRPLLPIGIAKFDSLAADPTRPSIFGAAGHAGRIVIFDVRDGQRLLEFAPGFARRIPKRHCALPFPRVAIASPSVAPGLAEL